MLVVAWNNVIWNILLIEFKSSKASSWWALFKKSKALSIKSIYGFEITALATETLNLSYLERSIGYFSNRLSIFNALTTSSK